MAEPIDLPLPERILDATSEALRRFGAEKTNVVDVAKALGMSHANIYRHFPSKKALLQAVAGRWLKVVTEPLTAIAADRSRPADERLVAWLNTLIATKRRKVLDDPELFQVYHGIAVQARDLVDEHVAGLVDLLRRIIEDGVAAGVFAAQTNPQTTAQAVLQATAAFHHPAMLVAQPKATPEQAEAVIALLMNGLRAKPTPT